MTRRLTLAVAARSPSLLTTPLSMPDFAPAGSELIDVPGKPFFDPEADEALFAALRETVRQTHRRRLVDLPLAINDPGFAEALVAAFEEVMA